VVHLYSASRSASNANRGAFDTVCSPCLQVGGGQLPPLSPAPPRMIFGDLDWPLNATRGFVSISWASCYYSCLFCCVSTFLVCYLLFHPFLNLKKWRGPEVINISHDHDPIYTSPVTKIHSVSKNATFYFWITLWEINQFWQVLVHIIFRKLDTRKL